MEGDKTTLGSTLSKYGTNPGGLVYAGAAFNVSLPCLHLCIRVKRGFPFPYGH